jgi:hypothetical protein
VKIDGQHHRAAAALLGAAPLDLVRKEILRDRVG